MLLEAAVPRPQPRIAPICIFVFSALCSGCSSQAQLLWSDAGLDCSVAFSELKGAFFTVQRTMNLYFSFSKGNYFSLRLLNS